MIPGKEWPLDDKNNDRFHFDFFLFLLLAESSVKNRFIKQKRNVIKNLKRLGLTEGNAFRNDLVSFDWSVLNYSRNFFPSNKVGSADSPFEHCDNIFLTDIQ